jgi:RNA polymerase sigma factor (sigma-70 family)
MTLEELFNEHHAALFRFIARMTNDPEFAQDIVQETFLMLAARPSKYEPLSRARLFQLGHSLARSGLRKRGRRRMLLWGGRFAVPAAAAAQPPDIGLERSEARSAVQRALALLTDRERTILLMREEGFTHREIAAAVGTTTGSVGTMFARALARLESALDEAWRRQP